MPISTVPGSRSGTWPTPVFTPLCQHRTYTCSISCAHEAVDKHAKNRVTSLRVADFESKQLIDAKKAVWVVGGSKQGVMTSVAKWAFTEKSGAERFVTKFGGRVAGFDDVWKTAAD